MECILLQKAYSDYLCNFYYKLLIVGQNISSNEFHYFHKFIFFTQNRSYLFTISYKRISRIF